MAKTRKEDLPGTLKRSPAKAQRTYAETLDSAHEQYDSEERAHRTALAALKHSFEKVGDHWEPKAEKGHSDDRAAAGGLGPEETAGGVDERGHSKREAGSSGRSDGMKGRSSMTSTSWPPPSPAGGED